MIAALREGPLSETEKEGIESVIQAAEIMGAVLMRFPDTPERAQAILKLRESVYWMAAGIAG